MKKAPGGRTENTVIQGLGGYFLVCVTAPPC